MADINIDLSPVLNTKIALFIGDPTLRRHAQITLSQLGFTDLLDQEVPKNYFQALSRLVPIVAGERELVLINVPPRPVRGEVKDNVVAVYEQVNELFLDLKTHLAKRQGDPLKHLSKTVPIIEVGDYLREKLVDVLFRYRVPAAFFMTPPAALKHLPEQKRKAVARENFQVHFEEYSRYLKQYFRDRDDLVAQADQKLSEKELSERKKKYDAMMAEAMKLKEKEMYEEAITLLRQAIEVFPKDIEAYLESGRLHTRRREYGRALSRFAQAEDLFLDAPAPNKEIANVRLVQVQEKIEAGSDPMSPEVMELLKDAEDNYRKAHYRSVEMIKKHSGDPDFEHPTAVGQEIFKWNLADLLGPKHPGVRLLNRLAGETTEALNEIPVEQLTTNQLLAMALQSADRGDYQQARRYYFTALKDREQFEKICSEINLYGIKLRAVGQVDEALTVYERLAKHQPPNLGSVFWNMAIAHAFKKDVLNAAGFAARCLYIDPFIAREQEFYDSLTPQLIPILINLMKILKLILVERKKSKPPPALVKLYSATDRLVHFMAEGNHKEALKLFMTMNRQVPQFTRKPEFHGDGAVAGFLEKVRGRLAGNPAHKVSLKEIDSWLKFVAENPAPPRLAKYLRLTMQAMLVMEASGDQSMGAFHFGQALVVVGESYFTRPDFYARENLPALAHELATKLKYVDVKRFPKMKPGKK